MEEETFGRAVSLDVGDLGRYALLTIGSFLVTFVVANLAKNMMRNNTALTIVLASVLFVSIFFSMRYVRKPVVGWLERYGWFVIPPVLAALVLMSSVKPVVFVVLFMLHGLACFTLRPLKNTARLGIELIMLITVLGSFAYGPKAGALLGATAMLMDYALTARLSYFVPITTVAYALVGFFAGSFSGYSITTVGIVSTVIYNVATSVIVLLMGGHFEKCLRFGISNIALNVMLFGSIAPWLLSIIT